MTARRVRAGGPNGSAGGALRFAEPQGVWSPSREDPLVGLGSQLIGGPVGRRLATGTGFWRAVPVLVLLAMVVFGVGALERQHCRAEGWSTPDQFWHACYSDIPVIYGSSGLGSSDRPGLIEAVGPSGLGLPPLAGAAFWAVSGLVPGTGSNPERQFFDLSVVLLAVALAISVVALAVARGRRRWDAAHLALSPVLVTAGLISYQLLAVMLAALAMLAWSRRRSLLGGLLLGLAMASGPQLSMLAVAVLIGAIRPAQRDGATLSDRAAVRDRAVRAVPDGVAMPTEPDRAALPAEPDGMTMPVVAVAGDDLSAGAEFPSDVVSGSAAGGSILGRTLGFVSAAGLTWLAVRILLSPGLTGGLADAWRDWRAGSPGYGSIWLVPQLLQAARPQRHQNALATWWFHAAPVPAGTAATLTVLGIVLVIAAVTAVALIRAEPLPVGSLALALLSGLLIVSKSLPVQSSLLLLPLIALAGLRWRDHLIWASTELVYFVGVWLYIAAQTTPSRGLPAWLYLLMVLARLAGIGWLGVQALRWRRLPVDNSRSGRNLWTSFEHGSGSG